MDKELKKNLELVTDTLKEANFYYHACHVLGYDQQTIAPKKAREAQGETSAFLGSGISLREPRGSRQI